MSAEYVNNLGSLIAYVVAAIIAIVFAITILAVAFRFFARSEAVDEDPAPSPSEAVDMTPPALTQTSQSNEMTADTSVEASLAEGVVETVTQSDFVTHVQFAGSKVTRKGTANDPRTWACAKSFPGVASSMALQAVRSTSTQRHMTAERLRAECVANAAVERKAELKRAKKYKARLKAFREDLLNASYDASEEALLEHHLQEAGVI